MKRIILLFSIAIGLTACNNGNNSNAITGFIPGIYVNQAQSGYSVANDTLIIDKAKNTDNIYLITRKTGYRRITDGKLQPLQHQVKRWSGTWDNQKQILEIMQTHTFLIFQPDKRNLLNGISEYWKL
jgi:phosphotransferase system  glucose/maltose/N-acetylglucosamine-specific IIC component